MPASLLNWAAMAVYCAATMFSALSTMSVLWAPQKVVVCGVVPRTVPPEETPPLPAEEEEAVCDAEAAAAARAAPLAPPPPPPPAAAGERDGAQ
ncbi:hypothetical protein ACQ858_22480 [Variovorax ureilyticus]|uniref:hypothetical protein n=1 Tax=Variovorax ureilyticus TaxID=1836198 RepID=UPI003D670458